MFFFVMQPQPIMCFRDLPYIRHHRSKLLKTRDEIYEFSC